MAVNRKEITRGMKSPATIPGDITAKPHALMANGCTVPLTGRDMFECLKKPALMLGEPSGPLEIQDTQVGLHPHLTLG